jgi:hypothetical protein
LLPDASMLGPIANGKLLTLDITPAGAAPAPVAIGPPPAPAGSGGENPPPSRDYTVTVQQANIIRKVDIAADATVAELKPLLSGKGWRGKANNGAEHIELYLDGRALPDDTPVSGLTLVQLRVKRPCTAERPARAPPRAFSPLAEGAAGGADTPRASPGVRRPAAAAAAASGAATPGASSMVGGGASAASEPEPQRSSSPPAEGAAKRRKLTSAFVNRLVEDMRRGAWVARSDADVELARRVRNTLHQRSSAGQDVSEELKAVNRVIGLAALGPGHQDAARGLSAAFREAQRAASDCFDALNDLRMDAIETAGSRGLRSNTPRIDLDSDRLSPT